VTAARAGERAPRTVNLVVAAVGCIVSVVVPVAGAGCAECVDDTDCAVTELCADGGCQPAPPATVELVAPTSTVGDRFDLVLDATFDGAQATLTVTRDEGAPGEPCLPFLDRAVIVDGGAGLTTRRVTFDDLPTLGETFSLRVTLETAGVLPVKRSFELRGPPVGDDVGGAEIISPGGDVDVDFTPAARLAVNTEGPAIAFVEPAGAAPLPRFAIAQGVAAVEDVIALVRGPQIVWVETTLAAGTKRCGRAVRGLPVGDDGGALDLTLIARAPEPAWVGLSLRIARGDDVDVCSGDEDAGLCQAGRPADGPSTVAAEQLQLRVDDAVVDVGVVPRVSVGPVLALVRVTHAGRHRGFLGPFTLLPDEGQSWVAGRVVVSAGTVVSVRPTDEVVIGAPW
jgi:hypothetical protein